MSRTQRRAIEYEIPVAPVFWPLLAPARYKGAHGGRGAAKSHFFAGLAISIAAGQAKRFLCLRQYQKSLAMSAKSLLESKIAAYGMGHLFDIQRERITSHAGALFIFEGMQAHNAESIKSYEDFDVAWFEEAHKASEESLTILRPTLRKSDSEMWFNWNPDQPSDPIQFLVDDPPPGTVTVEANHRDNPWFPGVLKGEMEYDLRRDPDKYAHVWEGKFRQSSEARVFRNWRVEEFEAAEVAAAAPTAEVVLPAGAAMIVLVSSGVLMWLFASYVAELHRFARTWTVLAAIIGLSIPFSMIASALLPFA